MMDEYPEMWQEFIENFSVLMQVDEDLIPMVPMVRVKQMMEHYHVPLVNDNGLFLQAIEMLHDVPAEDEILRLEKENEELRKLVEDLYSEAYFEDSDRIEYRYLGKMRGLGLKTVSWS